MFDWPQVLDFWFGPLDSDNLPDQAHRKRWFAPSRSFDREVRRRFFSMMLIASEGGLEHWRKDAGGRLAEIILLDQIPRQVYRGGAMAFDYDPLARKHCAEALDCAADLELPLIGRAFMYMPLQHAEKLEDQDRAVALYEQTVALAAQGRPRDIMQGFLDSARAHREIIARFGRFPHRNRVLKRSTTPEESAFLEAGADSFGQDLKR